MLPNFLLTDQVVRQNGSGPVTELGDHAGGTVTIALGITRTIEQQSLDVLILGSADGETWLEKPLARFPQKFYCGVYSMLLDLSEQPDVRFLRVDWKVSRWGRGEPTPLFGMYVYAEPESQHAIGATA